MCGVYANVLDMAFSQNGLKDTVTEHPYLMAVMWSLSLYLKKVVYCVSHLDPTQTNTESCAMVTLTGTMESLNKCLL